jgi:hypothetical protein
LGFCSGVAGVGKIEAGNEVSKKDSPQRHEDTEKQAKKEGQRTAMANDWVAKPDSSFSMASW